MGSKKKKKVKTVTKTKQKDLKLLLKKNHRRAPGHSLPAAGHRPRGVAGGGRYGRSVIKTVLIIILRLLVS